MRATLSSSACLCVLLSALSYGCGSSSSQPSNNGGAAGQGGAGAAGGAAGAAGAGGPIALAPGDVAELPVDSGTAGARIATPKGDEKYVLILASTRFDASGAQLDYSLNLDAAPDGATATPVESCSIGTDPWSTTPLPKETPPSGTAVAVGTTRTINVPGAVGYEAIQAKAIAVGKSAIVWADITPAHPANLDTAFVNQFLSDFEDTILPRERTVFGMESDEDGDGHISLVFTPNTYQTAVAFFTGCDLSNLGGCFISNKGEYLYLTPPDAIAPPYNTPNAIKEILTHECGHLVSFNQKELRNNLTTQPDSLYMDEGVGGFAQDVVGPQAGNLYVAMAGLDGIDQFSLGDTLLDGAKYDLNRDGVLRGGSYWFVRWLYDRAGGDTISGGSIQNKGGPAFLRALLDAKTSIATDLPVETKASVSDIAADFYTTLAMSNRDETGGVAPTNSCFAFQPTTTDPVWQTQRGGDVYAKFHGMQMNGPKTQPATSADGKLQAGGVEYLDVDAKSGQPELDLTVTVDPNAKARVRIGRIR